MTFLIYRKEHNEARHRQKLEIRKTKPMRQTASKRGKRHEEGAVRPTGHFSSFP